MKIGMALGGGGARGLAHLGVLWRLVELGFPVHCVAGTSIGAVMGAMFASDSLDRAFAWCAESDWRKLAGLFLDRHLTSKALIKGECVERLLGELIPVRQFSDLSLPFAAVATDLRSGEEIVMKDGDLLQAVRASISIPGVFRPVQRDGRILVDGGLVNPLPVATCRELGADAVLAVDVTPPKRGSECKPFDKMNIFDVLMDTFRVFNVEATRRILRDAPPEALLRPDVGATPVLDFRHAERLVMQGRMAVDGAMDEIARLMELAE